MNIYVNVVINVCNWSERDEPVMAGQFTVSLNKIIKDFNLEPLYLPEEEIMISVNEVNRPGLHLSGFYEYFDPNRIQITGKMEFAYLESI